MYQTWRDILHDDGVLAVEGEMRHFSVGTQRVVVGGFGRGQHHLKFGNAKG